MESSRPSEFLSATPVPPPSRAPRLFSRSRIVGLLAPILLLVGCGGGSRVAVPDRTDTRPVAYVSPELRTQGFVSRIKARLQTIERAVIKLLSSKAPVPFHGEYEAFYGEHQDTIRRFHRRLIIAVINDVFSDEMGMRAYSPDLAKARAAWTVELNVTQSEAVEAYGSLIAGKSEDEIKALFPVEAAERGDGMDVLFARALCRSARAFALAALHKDDPDPERSNFSRASRKQAEAIAILRQVARHYLSEDSRGADMPPVPPMPKEFE